MAAERTRRRGRPDPDDHDDEPEEDAGGQFLLPFARLVPVVGWVA